MLKLVVCDGGEELADGAPDFVDAHRRLRGARDVPELFSTAAAVVSTSLGFERAVVLTIAGNHLTAADSGPLADPASDTLRRRVLASPVPLPAGSWETVASHPFGTAHGAPSGGHVALERELSLREWIAAPVTSSGRPVAVLLADRGLGEAGPCLLRDLTLLADLIAGSLELIVLRARVRDLSVELRQATATAVAFANDALAPVTLPSQMHARLPYPMTSASAPDRERARGPLSERELEILELLARGRSNPEIAAHLTLSPETVKAHLARIFRKLGVTNRVEAAAWFHGRGPSRS